MKSKKNIYKLLKIAVLKKIQKCNGEKTNNGE